MEHLVDLSFTYEDRLELVRSVCNPGSTFSKYLNLHPVILLSTLPGPFIPRVFLPEDSVFYFRRLDKFSPSASNFADSLKLKYYKYRPPVFMQDVAQWFHSSLLQELYELPVFVSEDLEAYRVCYRHFPIPYPKPSREDVFSLTRDRLYDVIHVIDTPEVQSSQRSELREHREHTEQDEQEPQEEYQQPVTTEVQSDEEGRQQVNIPQETKQNLDSIFRKINEGKF